MEFAHITPELMDAVGSGDLAGEVFAFALWKHIQEVCPECSRGYEAWVKRGSRDYGESFGRAMERFSAKADGLTEKEKATSKREFAELRRLPLEERERRIRNATKRFRSPFLVDLLIECSNGLLHEDREGALHFARLALAVAERSHSTVAPDKVVIASARVGNALRAGGNLREAERFLGEARLVLRRSTVLDSLVHAELDSLEASLRKDQRRFDDAQKLLARAIVTYRLAKQPVDVARNLLNLADVHFYAGDVGKAVEVLYEAIRLPQEKVEERLQLWVRHNLAIYLVEAGDLEGAKRVYSEIAELYGSFPDKGTALRGRWLRARISRAEGNYREAEAIFREIASGFTKLGIGYDAALALLDLAELYYAAGAHKSLRRLAESLTKILEAEDLHREAVAALLLVQSAILERVVTATLLRRVRLYLDEARNNPSLKLDDL